MMLKALYKDLLAFMDHIKDMVRENSSGHHFRFTEPVQSPELREKRKG